MEKVSYLFVEKPVTLTIEEGEALIAKSKACNCKVQIGQVIRFWDEYVALKEMADNKVYGKIVNANFRRLSPRPEWGWNNWLLDHTLSGGAGQDLHIHDVDYDTGEGFIRYRHGATLSFWAMNNYGCDDPIEIRLLCEKGKVVMSYDDAIITFHDGTVLSTSTQNDGIYYEGGKDYWGFQHIRQIADFYDAVEHDREPRISGEEALKIQKLICEIYEKGSWK